MNIINVNTDAYWNGFERWVSDTPSETHLSANYHKYCGLRLIPDCSPTPVEQYRFELIDQKRWLLSKLKYEL